MLPLNMVILLRGEAGDPTKVAGDYAREAPTGAERSGGRPRPAARAGISRSEQPCRQVAGTCKLTTLANS